MTQNKTPPHIKLDERNHVENPLHFHLNMPDRDIIALMQDLLTGKMRVTLLLTEPQEAGA
uniref:Uncharacterized protein n=1 Tax=Candidatus Methanogaster sp. ANME-2c ERB4 TaxID=2759911 RepID=A0A7G9YGB3_9EURY|nr:hypothetical protein NBCJMJBN_00008 [Methanosarcinales archaeon ANME-2c ERB4]